MRTLLKYFYQLKRNQKGQSLVEFALILPVLLLLVFGIIQFGIIFNGQISVTSAAREGARVAVVSGEVEARNRVKNALAGALLVDFDHTDPGNVIFSPTAPPTSGEEWAVTVKASVPILVPLLPGLVGGTDFNLESTSVMRMEISS